MDLLKSIIKNIYAKTILVILLMISPSLVCAHDDNDQYHEDILSYDGVPQDQEVETSDDYFNEEEIFLELQMQNKIRNRKGNGPVWNPFINNLAKCASGCKPTGWHTYRKQVNSCHNTGRAIDVFGFKCGGKNYSAYTAKFASIVKCMKGKMKVLYKNGPGKTSGHNDHAHFSIGCSIPGHPKYY